MMDSNLWKGSFGDEYIKRNNDKKKIENNINFFCKALGKMEKIKSALEIGCGSGLNLAALNSIDSSVEYNGCDVNQLALFELENNFHELGIKMPITHNCSLNEFGIDVQYDLVITKGYLIKVQPEDLHFTYQKIYDLSRKYILLAEYYNPDPIEIEYRGKSRILYKRDFCSDMKSKFNLDVVDYGFVWNGDKHPQDDINWFLLKKNNTPFVSPL